MHFFHARQRALGLDDAGSAAAALSRYDFVKRPGLLDSVRHVRTSGTFPCLKRLTANFVSLSAPRMPWVLGTSSVSRSQPVVR